MTIPEDKITFFNSTDAANNHFLSVADKFVDDDDLIMLGLYNEFSSNGGDESLHVLSLSFPDRFELPLYVLHLHKMQSFPESLKFLLGQKSVVAVGRQIGGDLNKLESQYGVKVEKRIELGKLCLQDIPDLQSTGYC